MFWPQIFLWSLISFVLGIALASFFPVLFSLKTILLIVVVAFFLLWFFSRREKLGLIAFCFLFFFIAVLRYEQALDQTILPEAEKFFGRKVRITAIVSSDPEMGLTKRKFEVSTLPSKVKVLVYANFYPEINYGDKILLDGVLKEPPESGSFNYKDYLKNRGIHFLMNYPQISLLEESGFSLKSFLYSFKNRLKASLEKIVNLRQAGIFEALLFGEEENISSDWKEKLNKTGIRHIAAVSGANITILTGLILEFFLLLGFWRKQAFWFSLVVIGFYVLAIAAPASAVRAAIMVGLVLFSQNCGRLADSTRILIFVLALMLFADPLLLKSDAGFQLSFLAVAGLVYLAPSLSNFLSKIIKLSWLVNSLATTLSAQIFVLPLLLFNFGRASLIAPLTNILFLPFVPVLTIAGFIFSFLGTISQPLGWLVSLPFQGLMQFFLVLVDFFSSLSFADLEFSISPVFLFISYAILATLVFLKRRSSIF